ncbi:MAG: GGDEF domain-containing protein [Anaerolineaceae bacterium]|nr:GGDEF domain-containing protein [Anaerolineaceae bacterium]
MNEKTINQQEKPDRQLIQEIHQCNETAYHLHFVDPLKGLESAIRAQELSISGIFQTEPYIQGLADSLLNQSYFFYLLGDMQQALEYAEESMQYYIDLDQLLPQAEIYAHLGLIYDIYNDRNSAIEYLVRGLEITKNNMYELTEGKILLYIGKAYLQMGNYRQSVHSILQARSIFKIFFQDDYEAIALINLADSYSMLNQSEKAFQSIYEALDIAMDGNYKVLQGEGFYRLGMMHLQNNEFDIAKSHLTYSQRIANKMVLKYISIKANLGLGEILLYRYETKPALDLFKRCLEEAQELKIDQLLVEVHRNLSEIYELSHQYKRSLDHFKKFSDITNKMVNKHSHQKIQTIEVLYRTRSAKREAELTRNKNLTLEKEIVERKKVEEELRKSEKQYRTMASFDPLTRLFNRRHFFNLAEIEFERAKRYDHSLAVMMIDLDHFKSVNDCYGHLIGDEMLAFVANLCKRSLRKIDVIGRYGGEEFIVLLPQTNADQAMILAQRLCKTIQQSSMPCTKGQVNITVSIGVSVNSLSYERLETLFDLADQALYRAKENGRDQVCLAATTADE